jgi:threonine synthase
LKSTRDCITVRPSRTTSARDRDPSRTSNSFPGNASDARKTMPDDPDPHPRAPADTAAAATSAPNGSSTVTTETANGIDLGSQYYVLDGGQVIVPELDAHRRKASNRDLPLVERLEAYEDIIDSEIGDTALTRLRNLEREFGLRQIYAKFEGSNPSGSQKDRIAFAQVLDAMRRGYEAVTVATCGNYGAALSVAAELGSLRCIVYIPLNYHTKRVQEIEERGATIVRAGEDYEEAVALSRARAEVEEIYDANPGGPNTSIHLRAYGEIAYEIYDDLRDAPAVVAVPVSNGTTLAGIHKGFVSLYRRGKTSRVPRIVAGSSFRKNPIVQAWLNRNPRCENLHPRFVRETPINEPLINWHSIDGDHALTAVRQTDGWAANASDKSLLDFAKLIREREGLNVLPASTDGLVALLERHRRDPLPGDRYIVILTGRKA